MPKLTKTYRRNVTKSRAGHSRLTLIDKATGVKVTSEYGWNDAAEALWRDEARLAEELAQRVETYHVNVARWATAAA